MLEATLVKHFKQHVYSKYASDGVDFFKHHQTSYEVQGNPDIQIKMKKLPWTIYVEAKRYTTPEEAFAGLRPSQVGRIQCLLAVGALVYLLYHGGCAQFFVDNCRLSYTNIMDITPFSAFDTHICKELSHDIATN